MNCYSLLDNIEENSIRVAIPALAAFDYGGWVNNTTAAPRPHLPCWRRVAGSPRGQCGGSHIPPRGAAGSPAPPPHPVSAPCGRPHRRPRARASARPRLTLGLCAVSFARRGGGSCAAAVNCLVVILMTAPPRRKLIKPPPAGGPCTS